MYACVQSYTEALRRQLKSSIEWQGGGTAVVTLDLMKMEDEKLPTAVIR